jgi:ferredoxin
VKLTLDTGACMGHGRCYSIAPQFFDADNEGHSVLLTTTVGPSEEVAAREAQDSCPEQAIKLVDQ